MPRTAYQDHTLSFNGQWAMTYATFGWRVLPLWEVSACESGVCSSDNCRMSNKSWGKHPRIARWPELASADPQQVADWWTQWPAAGVALATGEGSGVLAVDVDPRNGGEESWESLSARVDVPETLWQRTGLYSANGHGMVRGAHYLFSWSPGLANNGHPAAGIDVKTDGGYVVLAPTQHASGVAYEWGVQEWTAPVPMPADLLAEMPRARSGMGAGAGAGGSGSAGSGEGRGGGAGSGGSEAEEIWQDGGRNVELAKRVGKWRNQHAGNERAVTLLAMQFGKELCSPPLSDAEIVGVVHSILRMERAELSPPPAEGLAWVTETEKQVEEHGPDEPIQRNDVGNALRLINLRGEDLHYVDLVWHAWNGHVHQPDDKKNTSTRGIVQRALQQYVQDREIPMTEDDSEERGGLEKWKIMCGNTARIDNALKEAAPRLRARKTDFDDDPWLLCADNCTIDLRTMKTWKHRRSDMLTKILPVKFDADAQCPKWDAFLEMILPVREDRDFLMDYAGYTACGDASARAALLMHGASGANGKSTVVETLRWLFGPYAMVAQKTLAFDKKGGDSDQFKRDVVATVGARMVTLAMELRANERVNEDAMKVLTGGDTISAKPLYCEEFKFKPQFKLWIPTNHRPKMLDWGDSMTDRMKMLPFMVQIPKGERRPMGAVLEEFQREGSGILNWVLEGFQRYHSRDVGEGLKNTESMDAEQAEWADDDDRVGTFITNHVVADTQSWMSADDVHAAFVAWLAQTHPSQVEFAQGAKTVSARLNALGRTGARHGGCRGWLVHIEGVYRP